ncbi:hypothetical protein ACIRPU_42500 [Streptomyces sp. NPDC102259]|uniref:hypothetical protein n=1 Tax=Streptomyces sp. NPDC102259 TaxID=3366148 RepID=UPI00381F7F5F
MTSVFAPPADTGSIQQTRAAMLALVEQRLRHLLAPRQTHRSAAGPRPALVADGGTRLRPVFCVSGFLAAGGNPGDPVAVDASAALELLYLTARIPGDLTGTGEDVPVLTGDQASAHADRLATRLPATARTAWTQLRTELRDEPRTELGTEPRPEPRTEPGTEPITGPPPPADHAATAGDVAGSAPSHPIAVHRPGRRTIHRPLVLGALLAGRPELAPAFEGYGLALDEACGLRDDLIDAFGPTQDTDRPAAPGSARNSTTLLLALAAERSPRAGALLAHHGHADAALLRRLLDESGTKATAERRIAGLVDKACAALATPALGRPWRQEFSRLATRLAYRD